MLTVPEAARRAARDPETIRRWIRSGRLRARKIGTQHVIEEGDLEVVLDQATSVALPPAWQRTHSGCEMPDVVAAIDLARRGR